MEGNGSGDTRRTQGLNGNPRHKDLTVERLLSLKTNGTRGLGSCLGSYIILELFMSNLLTYLHTGFKVSSSDNGHGGN